MEHIQCLIELSWINLDNLAWWKLAFDIGLKYSDTHLTKVKPPEALRVIWSHSGSVCKLDK